MKLLTEGAEASIYLDGNIIKQRYKKGYRIKALDDKLRVARTRREAKILKRLKGKVAVPNVIFVDEKKTSLGIEFIDGRMVKDVISRENCTKIGEEIGSGVGIMHNNNIIHGDLTTSNMIKNRKIYFIDFGLGFFSDKLEDKAVDLHLLKQALASSHSKISGKCFAAAVNGYRKTTTESEKVLERLEKVESRGRYKGKKKL